MWNIHKVVLILIGLSTSAYYPQPLPIQKWDDLLKISGYWEATWPGHTPLSLYVKLRGTQQLKPRRVFILSDVSFRFGSALNSLRYFSLSGSKDWSDPGWNFPVVNFGCLKGEYSPTTCEWNLQFDAARNERSAGARVGGKTLVFVFRRTASQKVSTPMSGLCIGHDGFFTHYLHVGPGTQEDGSTWTDTVQALPDNQLALDLGVVSSVIQDRQNIKIEIGTRDSLCCGAFWEGTLIAPNRMSGHWRGHDEVSEWRFSKPPVPR